MKRLSSFYPSVKKDVMVKDIKINSKKVSKNDIFVCVHGSKTDHHLFAYDAVENGASAVVASRNLSLNVPVILCKNTNKELVSLARKFYDYKGNIKVIGVTGTDGKTSVSIILKQLLGNSCAYMGTNGFWYKNQKKSLENTTPEAHILYKNLAFLERKKIPYVSMEVSSEALYFNRTRGVVFDGAILTNITSDHLNIHKTLDHYIACKCKLFRRVRKSGIIVLNRDDPNFYKVLPFCFGNVVTYGKDPSSDYRIVDVKLYEDKTIFTFSYLGNIYKVKSPLVGMFNVSNLLACIAYLMSCGIPYSYISKRIKNIYIPGRCEVLPFSLNNTILLDYAHTENALYSVLSFLALVKKNRLITVVGSAGGRDKTKRRGMGKVVQEYSDLVFYTMDDPRNEDPREIIEQMIDKTKKNYKIIIDRKKAIHSALRCLKRKDILIICGKGRDNYMAVFDKKIPYSDYEVVDEYFNSNKK